MTTPTLATPGAVLRPLETTDASALFVALGDPMVQRYRRQPPHENVGETVGYIEATLANGYGWAITEDGGEALGRIALRQPAQSAGEIGIVLRRDAQRRGLGSRALRLVSAFAFETLGLSRLRAEIDSNNKASLALFTRAGFQCEAFVPASNITHTGMRDNVVMGKHSGGTP